MRIGRRRDVVVIHELRCATIVMFHLLWLPFSWSCFLGQRSFVVAPASVLSRRARPYSLTGQPHVSNVSTNGLWQNLTPPAGCCSCKVGYRGGWLASCSWTNRNSILKFMSPRIHGHHLWAHTKLGRSRCWSKIRDSARKVWEYEDGLKDIDRCSCYGP